MPPEQQDLVRLVDDGGRRDGAEPDHEVVEVVTVGEYDIRQIDPEPAVLVHSLFVQIRPLHSSATF